MRAKRADANQPEIVQALRNIGARVAHTHEVGGGFPDLVVAHRGRNVLLEVKRPGEKPNKMQLEFIAEWGGEMHIVHSAEEAVAAVIGKEAMR